MNIDLSEYKLVRPSSIRKKEGIGKFYDIEIEDNHTFFISGNNDIILSHNCDGNSIAGLLLNFFFKYWPEMFERRMVCKVETPIVVAVPRNKKSKKISFYTQTEYDEWVTKPNLKNYEIKYKKGLAALVGDEYNDIINNPKITLITKDDFSEKSLEMWFGKDTKLRKEELLK